MEYEQIANQLHEVISDISDTTRDFDSMHEDLTCLSNNNKLLSHRLTSLQDELTNVVGELSRVKDNHTREMLDITKENKRLLIDQDRLKSKVKCISSLVDKSESKLISAEQKVLTLETELFACKNDTLKAESNVTLYENKYSQTLDAYNSLLAQVKDYEDTIIRMEGVIDGLINQTTQSVKKDSDVKLSENTLVEPSKKSGVDSFNDIYMSVITNVDDVDLTSLVSLEKENKVKLEDVTHEHHKLLNIII
ncbi:MAG: hypothetical protein ACRDD8_10610 [Bacteroidales bacterium]